MRYPLGILLGLPRSSGRGRRVSTYFPAWERIAESAFCCTCGTGTRRRELTWSESACGLDPSVLNRWWLVQLWARWRAPAGRGNCGASFCVQVASHANGSAANSRAGSDIFHSFSYSQHANDSWQLTQPACRRSSAPASTCAISTTGKVPIGVRAQPSHASRHAVSEAVAEFVRAVEGAAPEITVIHGGVEIPLDYSAVMRCDANCSWMAKYFGRLCTVISLVREGPDLLFGFPARARDSVEAHLVCGLTTNGVKATAQTSRKELGVERRRPRCSTRE